MTAPVTPRKRARRYQQTGVFGAKRALRERGIKALDGRTTAARAIREWRSSVEADLGGRDALSRQEQTVLDMASAAVFLLGMIDTWIGGHPELLISTRRRSLAPVVRERIVVANHLRDCLATLGLKRYQGPPLPPLDALALAGRIGEEG